MPGPDARLARVHPKRCTRIGSYEVTALIGAGGMGEVYRATDTNLKRQVAIKVLPADLSSSAARVARLRREAELLAQLNHPNIAAIYGLEGREDQEGVRGPLALVMEFIEGPTLEELLARTATRTGRPHYGRRSEMEKLLGRRPS